MGLQNEMLVNATETLSDVELAAVEHLKEFPNGLMKISMALCVILMLIGIPGNIITIFALARYKKVRNVTAIFIINLSCSDLLYCCFNLPLETSKFHHRAWIYGEFLCQMSLFTTYALVINTSLTVIAITITRYIIIVHPKLYTKIYKKRNVIIILVLSWLFTIGTVIPIVFEEYGNFNFNLSHGSCSILKNPRKRSIKTDIFLSTFGLPCIAIILCYTRIFCIVQKATKKSSKTRKRVPNPVKQSSDNLSTYVSMGFTGEAGCNHMVEQTKTIKLVLTKNATDRSTNLEMSDNIIQRSEILKNEQTNRTTEIMETAPEILDKEPPRLQRTALIKSIKLLKLALPTRKDRRLGTMILAIIIAYCLSYLPITIIKVFLDRNRHPKLIITSHILFYSSHCLNPIIYVVMSNEYRKAYKYLFTRQHFFIFRNRTKKSTLSKI